MACTLLGLPAEVRLNIYSHLFDEQQVFVDAGNLAGPAVMLPTRATPTRIPDSAQVLRTCKTLRAEAEPLLYQHLTFHVSNNTFAGSLPYRVSEGNAIAPRIRHLVWQLQCDLLKKFYFEDLAITAEEVAQLDTLEIRCRCENWRDSYHKDAVPTEQFLRNRQQVVDYLKCLQAKAAAIGVVFILAEDPSLLKKGELRLRLSKVMQGRVQEVSVCIKH